MNRRSFLKFQLKGALWLAAGASGLVRPKTLTADTGPEIAAAKGDPAAATAAAVGLLGGMGRFVKKGARVVIKPNMSFPTGPERGSNTHPLVVSTLAAMCKQAGASQVLVLDNPLGPAEACLERSGIASACQVLDEDMARMVTDDSLYKETVIPEGRVMKKAEVMKAVLEADVLIAAPVAKSHSGAVVSLVMKGMMGLVNNRRMMHFMGLDESIVDLAGLLKPDLSVIDATRVLSTRGPGGPGKVLRENTVIASTDMVAADALAVSRFEWYGRRFKPGQVPHIRMAHERGLGRIDVENFKVRTVTV